MVQLVETGTQERMLDIRLRFAKPSSYRFENKMEGQRNNTGHQFDEVSSLIEIAITYMDRRPCCRTGTQGTRSTRTRARGMGALVTGNHMPECLCLVCEYSFEPGIAQSL